MIPGNNIEWMTGQCAKLYQGILVAAKIETAYERAQTDSARAKILPPLFDIAPDEPAGGISGRRAVLGDIQSSTRNTIETCVRRVTTDGDINIHAGGAASGFAGESGRLTKRAKSFFQ